MATLICTYYTGYKLYLNQTAQGSNSMTINMYLALNSGYSLYIGARTNYINGTKVSSAAISTGGGGSFDLGTVNITGLSPSTSYSISGNFNLAANIGGAGTKSWMNGKASFSTAAARYWNDVNALNPNGVQDSASAYFDLYTSENNSTRYNLVNEDTDMTHVAGSYFEVRNIRPFYDYYELNYVSGHDSEPTAGTYRKTFDAEGEILTIQMKYKSYYRDINAWKPGNAEQGGLLFDYYIYNRDGTLVDSYTNVSNEVANTVTREYGYTGKINNIRTNVTGAHYTSNNITGTGAGEFTWTFNTTTAVELYSAWNTYTVTYNGNGATSGSTANSSHTYGTAKALTANGFSRTGYTFLGWSTNSAATTATYSNQQSVSNLTATNGGTVTLYAIWQRNNYTVTIRRTTGIADITAPAWAWTGDYKTSSVAYGTSMNINVSLSTGYHWVNWSGSISTTTQNYTFTVGAQNYDITANAAANTYTVAYNANGGTGTTASSSHTYNVAKALTANGFTRSGYEFVGWSTSSTATTATYTNGQSVTNLTSTHGATVTLYAVWKLAQANLYTKKSGAWVKGPAYVKVNGSWVTAKQVYTKVNGAWVLNK